MSVYVDDMNASYGRMKMCHMMADSTQELLDMATVIGVDHKWIQAKGTYKEHFDIAKSKKALAIENGAIAVTQRDIGKMLVARKWQAPPLNIEEARWIRVRQWVQANIKE